MSSNLKVNSLVPATGTEIGIGTTGGSIDFRCPATFGGNVTIGGTLTYDEVINIDSIGIVTARSGLNVQAGQLDVGSNIKLGNAGVVTATSLDISGDIDVDGQTELDNVNISGVSTFRNELQITPSNSSSYTTHLNYNNTGTNYISHANGGATSFRNSSSGGTAMIIQGSNKAVDIDSTLRHLGDTDTLMQFGDNSITLSVGNEQAVNILPTSAGSGGARMGLGTNSPTGMLHIYGANPPVRIQNSNDSANLQIGMWDTANVMFQVSHRPFKLATETSHPIVFHTGGLNNERLRITSSGAVGINTTVTAATKLQVQSDGTSTTAGGNIVARFQSNGSGRDATIQLSDNVANSATISMLSSALILKQSGTERVRIKSNGHTGIGTDDPLNRLHVRIQRGNSTGLTASAALDSGNNLYLPATRLENSGMSGNIEVGQLFLAGNTDQAQWLISCKKTGSNVGDFIFRTRTAATTSAERLRITSQGLVGINVTSPSQALHVAGSIINSTSVNSTGDQGIQMGNGHRLGFDQSGTRSWTMKANVGNLTFNSGDGNGAFDFNTTAHLKLPTGTSAQRVNTTGAIRFNSDVGNLEFYDGSSWKRIRLLEDAPTSGLLAYWPFSSASRSGSTYNDVSGNGQHLTVNGTITDDTTETKFSGCIDFGTADGNHYLKSSSSSFTDIDASSGYSGVSISVWVKTTVTNNFQQWIISEGTVNTRWNYFVENDYGPKWRSVNTNDVHMTGNPGMMTGNWHHLVVTYNSSNNLVKHYRDGSFINQGTTGTPSFTGGYLLVGQHSSLTGNSSSYRWRGKMAHMRLYNRVLTESEVTVLSQQW